MRDVNWLEELVSAITREMSWFRKKKSSYFVCYSLTHKMLKSAGFSCM